MELTAEHKVKILSSQRKVLAAQMASQNAERQLETSYKEYVEIANSVSKELGLDPQTQQLDLDALEVKTIQIPDTDKKTKKKA